MKPIYHDFLILAAIGGLIGLASWYGTLRAKQSHQQIIEQNISAGLQVAEIVNGNKWLLSSTDGKPAGTLYYGEGKGYNGTVSVLTQISSSGQVIQVTPIANHETPSYFKKLAKTGFFSKASGVNIQDFLQGEPMDAVSGATISSKAVTEGIRNGYAAGENLTFAKPHRLVFGVLEFLIVLLLLTGLIIQRIMNRKYRRAILWGSWIVSLVFLGFVYNQPITLSRIVAIFSGYFPDSTQEFYLYILLGGSILAVLLTGKNIYCHSVCPFGAAQEVLGKTGNAKLFKPAFHKKLKILQWSGTLVAVLIALALGNPAAAQYEVFGALFQLTAGAILFLMLFIVIVLSLFIKRPWCRYMCPIDGVFRFVRLFRDFALKLGISRKDIPQ